MYVLPAIPTVGAIFKDAALRKQCVTDTIWKVYVAELHFVVVQLLSHVQLFVIPWIAALQAFLSFTISQSFLKFMSIESVIPSNHLILYCLLFLLTSILPSVKVFSKESVLCIKWPKY